MSEDADDETCNIAPSPSPVLPSASRLLSYQPRGTVPTMKYTQPVDMSRRMSQYQGVDALLDGHQQFRLSVPNLCSVPACFVGRYCWVVEDAKAPSLLSVINCFRSEEEDSGDDNCTLHTTVVWQRDCRSRLVGSGSIDPSSSSTDRESDAVIITALLSLTRPAHLMPTGIAAVVAVGTSSGILRLCSQHDPLYPSSASKPLFQECVSQSCGVRHVSREETNFCEGDRGRAGTIQAAPIVHMSTLPPSASQHLFALIRLRRSMEDESTTSLRMKHSTASGKQQHFSRTDDDTVMGLEGSFLVALCLDGVFGVQEWLFPTAHTLHRCAVYSCNTTVWRTSYVPLLHQPRNRIEHHVLLLGLCADMSVRIWDCETTAVVACIHDALRWVLRGVALAVNEQPAIGQSLSSSPALSSRDSSSMPTMASTYHHNPCIANAAFAEMNDSSYFFAGPHQKSKACDNRTVDQFQKRTSSPGILSGTHAGRLDQALVYFRHMILALPCFNVAVTTSPTTMKQSGPFSDFQSEMPIPGDLREENSNYSNYTSTTNSISVLGGMHAGESSSNMSPGQREALPLHYATVQAEFSTAVAAAIRGANPIPPRGGFDSPKASAVIAAAHTAFLHARVLTSHTSTGASSERCDDDQLLRFSWEDTEETSRSGDDIIDVQGDDVIDVEGEDDRIDVNSNDVANSKLTSLLHLLAPHRYDPHACFDHLYNTRVGLSAISQCPKTDSVSEKRLEDYAPLVPFMGVVSTMKKSTDSEVSKPRSGCASIAAQTPPRGTAITSSSGSLRRLRRRVISARQKQLTNLILLRNATLYLFRYRAFMKWRRWCLRTVQTIRLGALNPGRITIFCEDYVLYFLDLMPHIPLGVDVVVWRTFHRSLRGLDQEDIVAKLQRDHDVKKRITQVRERDVSLVDRALSQRSHGGTPIRHRPRGQVVLEGEGMADAQRRTRILRRIAPISLGAINLRRTLFLEVRRDYLYAIDPAHALLLPAPQLEPLPSKKTPLHGVMAGACFEQQEGSWSVAHVAESLKSLLCEILDMSDVAVALHHSSKTAQHEASHTVCHGQDPEHISIPHRLVI